MLTGILTIKKLKEMEPNTIFRVGTVQDNGTLYKWAACRGGIHDWCIYMDTTDKAFIEVQQNGNKIFTESKIKQLITCNDEAFEMYRY